MKKSSTKKVVEAEVTSNREVSPGHFVMEVKSAYLGKNARPGQFVNVKVRENTTDPLLRIPLGVHSISASGIKLLYKAVGKATGILSEKKKGETVSLLGPLGNSFDTASAKKDKKAEVIVVAGGHGIAPLYALCEKMIEQGMFPKVFIGVRDKNHLTSRNELRKMGISVIVSSIDGSVGARGNVTELVREEITELKKNNRECYIYSCGPRPMLKELARIASAASVPAQVSLDAYMACGIGVCLGCAIKTINGYKLVCKDGPVFSAAEIVWEEV